MVDCPIHTDDERPDDRPRRQGDFADRKSFEVDFCTVARWDNGEIVEENLFYEVVGFMSQIGVGK